MADQTKNTYVPPSVGKVGSNVPAMDKEGSIGKHFTETGAIGGTAQKIGGPLAKDGAIGKQFTTGGSIGGAVQNTVDEAKKSG